MKKVKILLILPIWLLIFMGCAENKIKNELIGMWLIQDVEHKVNTNNAEQHLTNVIVFEKDGDVVLPVYFHESFEHNEGKWKVEKDSSIYKIIIESSNELFSGFFKINRLDDLAIDGKKVKELQLESSKCIIVSFKHPGY